MEQDKPDNMYASVGLDAAGIVASAVAALGMSDSILAAPILAAGA